MGVRGKSIRKIIKEEVRKFLKEYSDDNLYQYMDGFDNVKQELVNDFLYENNGDFTKPVQWSLIPFNPVKKIWEDYIRYGYVKNVKGLESIERIAIRNIIKIDIFTNFGGHVSYNESDEYLQDELEEFAIEQVNCYLRKPEDANQLEIDYDNHTDFKRKTPQPECTVHPFIKEYLDENITNNIDVNKIESNIVELMSDRFSEYYGNNGYVTDYGLRPLQTLAVQLYAENDPNKKLVLIDKILNVAHHTSDLAAWIIQGGSSSLNLLSGYDDDEGDSVISGRYSMSDYR